MSFQIHNQLNQAVPIKDLDEEACKFWNKPVHPKNYATPRQPVEGESELQKVMNEVGNWFDIVGWAIHSPCKDGYGEQGWDAVRKRLWTIQTDGNYTYINDMEKLKMHTEVSALYLQPYFALIDYWQGKSYFPVKPE